MSFAALCMGLGNAVQEAGRDASAAPSAGACIVSKIGTAKIVCLAQAILLTAFIAVFIGLPERGLIFIPSVETALTAFIAAVAASCFGFFVSSLFKKKGAALAAAIFLIAFALQALLAAAAFHPKMQALRPASYATVPRCALEAFAMSGNLLEAARQEGYKEGQKIAEEQLQEGSRNASGWLGGKVGEYSESAGDFIGSIGLAIGGAFADRLVKTDTVNKMVKERVDAEINKVTDKYGLNFRATKGNLVAMWLSLCVQAACFAALAYWRLKKTGGHDCPKNDLEEGLYG
jgi:hypothetical protein